MSTALAHAPTADATRVLYERHSSRIFGFCLSRLGSREEAEDAVQTTFLNAQRGLGRGVVPDFELAWLFKIAQNVCHNRHQSARRRGCVEATHDLDAMQDVLATPERGASVSLSDLTQALSAVPERQRRALLLREFQGLSYEEISLELGVSVSAVETLIFRARRSVAAELGRLGTKPSRRGAVASIAEVFSWLFKGGAAPLKVAAAVTTIATLAAAPVIEHQLSTSPSAPKPATATKLTRVVVPSPKVVHVVSRPSLPVSSNVSPAVTGSSVDGGSTSLRNDPPSPGSPASSASPPATAGAATPPVTPIAVSLPLQVSVPDVASLPTLTVPSLDAALALPTVTVPNVADVPVTLPPVTPQLP